MISRRLAVFAALAACSLTGVVAGHDEAGFVGVDKYTFDLVVDGSKHVLAKFDSDYPSGPKHDEYKKLLKEYTKVSPTPNNFLFVAIKRGYGDADNTKLLDRFDVEQSDFPAYRFFPQGDAKDWREFKGKNATAGLSFSVHQEALRTVVRCARFGSEVGFSRCQIRRYE